MPPVSRLYIPSGRVANPNRYSGGYLDTYSGLYHFGARYYDPTLGRWTQLDPTGQSAGYAYAGEDPINNTDPTGQGFLGDVLSVAGAVAGVAGLVTLGAATGGVGAAVGAAATGFGANLGIAGAITSLLGG